MNSLRSPFVVYLLGLLPLGIFDEPVKYILGGGAVFFLAALVYLLFLRGIGWLVSRRSNDVDA